jgi:hypothetical protein
VAVDTSHSAVKALGGVANFCPECGASVEGMKFGAECGTLVDGTPTAPQRVATLSHDEQVAILEREIAALAKQGWHVYGRPTPYEVCLKRKSGLTARRFFALWVEDDGSLWTNAAGAVEGGRLRDIPLPLHHATGAAQPHSVETGSRILVISVASGNGGEARRRVPTGKARQREVTSESRQDLPIYLYKHIHSRAAV